jgi:hypothetical protein
MPDIRADVEVRELIGAGNLRQLREDASVRYQCWQCSREGLTTEPTSVIVLAYRVVRVVRLAHAARADSHVIGVAAAAMRTVAGRTGALQHGQQAGGAGGQLRSGESYPAKKS